MTSTNTLGIRNGNQIIPYGSTTRQTKVITNATSSEIVLAGAGITTFNITGSQLLAYRDSGNNWRLRFNVRVVLVAIGSARTIATITFQGAYAVIFASARQAVSAVEISNLTPATAQTEISDGVVTISHASYSSNGYQISGDVALASEPTWASANMEGAVNASVYIPAASATETGLVSTAAQTIAGVKTFTNGISLGNETLNTYDEGTFSATFDTGAMTGASAATVTVKYIKIGNTVTLLFPDTRKSATADNSTWSTSAVALPLTLTPVVDIYIPFITLTTGVIDATVSRVAIQQDRKLVIAKSANWVNGTANCGFLNGCVTYLLT